MRTRRLKIEDSSAVYHCISRVVGGEFLLEGEREKEVLRNQIWKVADFCGIQVLTYCIMSNHVHLLIRTPERRFLKHVPNSELARRAKRIYSPEVADGIVEGLNSREADTRERFRDRLLARMGDVSVFMKELKQRFSIWYNKTHRRFGTLWAERFKSVLVEDDPMALSTIAAYIDLNPVRARLAADPAEYRFCGYAEAMGGFMPARAGIASLLGERQGWALASETYRVALFGKGHEGKGASRSGGSIDPERVSKVMNEGGRVGRAEALRCRIRYFVDGAVLGSKGFVSDFLDGRCVALASRRRRKPQPLQGGDWTGLFCGKGLRKQIFAPPDPG